MPTFDLLFVPAPDPDGEPVAHVLLTTEVQHGYPDVQPGQRLVTAPATSAAELDYQITMLHEELERIRDVAREKFEAVRPSSRGPRDDQPS